MEKQEVQAHTIKDYEFRLYFVPLGNQKKSCLKRHFSIVHEQKATKNTLPVFKCSQCEKRYKNSETLRNHTNKFHKDTTHYLEDIKKQKFNCRIWWRN